MTRLAISGHRGLPETTAALVETKLRAKVATYAGPELVGLSLLADGPDTMFARAVLDMGGSLVVVVPAERYSDALPTEHHATYDALVDRAAEVIRLDRVASDSEAHMAGSETMLARADRLLAVWDGQPARGYGGTADVVDRARRLGMPVTVIWPAGASRD